MLDATGVAIVGLGYWGPALARNLAALPEARLLHLVDRDPARAEQAAERHAPEVPAHGDFEAALRDDAVQAVVIATPVRTHFELARQALQAGKNVLVEKPLAMTVAECRQLEALADERGLVLMVGHIFRFNAAVEQIRRYIAGGILGEVLYVHGRRVNLGRVQSDVNALWSFAPHDFSIVDHWLDAAPVAVAARGFSYIQDGVEDVVFCTVDYPGGASAHLHLGWLDPRKVREMTVVGSRRMVVFDDVSPHHKVQLFDSSITPMHEAPESFADWQVDIRHGDVTIPLLKWAEPLRAECAHFLACIREGVACRTPAAEGTIVTASIVAAQLSLKRGGVAVTLEEVLGD